VLRDPFNLGLLRRQRLHAPRRCRCGRGHWRVYRTCAPACSGLHGPCSPMSSLRRASARTPTMWSVGRPKWWHDGRGLLRDIMSGWLLLENTRAMVPCSGVHCRLHTHCRVLVTRGYAPLPCFPPGARLLCRAARARRPAPLAPSATALMRVMRQRSAPRIARTCLRVYSPPAFHRVICWIFSACAHYDRCCIYLPALVHQFLL